MGYIEHWAQSSRNTLTVTRMHQKEILPDPETIDMLVIMGGPMSVNETNLYPWLISEKIFIQKCIELSLPVIGICLGAQLIASVLGSRVYPNKNKEIGWYEIRKTKQAEKNSLSEVFPLSLKAFHWHGETFDLPQNSCHIVSSEACTNQAFLYRDRVLGLQFHLEATAESAALLLKNCIGEIAQPGPYIQTKEQITGSLDNYTEINSCMKGILDYLSGMNRHEN